MAPVVSTPSKAILRKFYTDLSYQPKYEAHSLNILKFLARAGVRKEKAISPANTEASTALLTPRGEETGRKVSLQAAACWTRTYAEEAAPKPTRPTMCRERHCSTGYLSGLCAELEPAELDLRIPEDKQEYIRSFYKDLQDGQAMVMSPHIRDADKWPQVQERASSPDGDLSDPRLTAGPALTRGITCDAQQREAADHPMQPCMRRERRRSSEYLASLCPSVPAALPEWPEAVYKLRARPDRFRLRACPKDPEIDSLIFQPAAFSIAHAAKSHGSEDSHFVGENRRCLGVADGVGEWMWKFGINARYFADELMLACEEYLTSHNPGDVQGDLRQHVLDALTRAHQQTRSFGSSTAVVAALGRHGQLGIANLGDSALAVLRRKEVGGGMRYICRTKEQQAHFNCPWQLARYPDPADYPQLIREGQESLVKAVQKSRDREDNGPEDSQLLSCQVQEGDLLILGTDGLWDNLHQKEVCDIVAGVVGPLEAEEGHFTEAVQIAEALAKAARWRSESREHRTPFTVACREAGVNYVGGKMDDVTCVCAWVVADS